MLHKLAQIILGDSAAAYLAKNVPTIKAKPTIHDIEREYIAREAAVGAELFGKVPVGRDRQFFCLDQHTWVWHEAWQDESKKTKSFTVYYDVRPQGILKRVNNGPASELRGEELRRFDVAIQKYYKLVAQRVYGRQVAAI